MIAKTSTITILFLLMAGLVNAQHPRYGFDSELPKNPLVQQMVDSVSEASLLSNLEALVGFHTRNTASDTTSSDTGIGAARNFVFGRFQEYANQSGGGLVPGFFTFPATVCGVFNDRHKNVLATITGQTTPGRTFVCSGHLDSRNINLCDLTISAPGANDDGTGSVLAMEMARVFSWFSNSFESSMILMTVTGEEQGLFGSTAYASWAAQSGLDIDGMITNDIVGGIVGCINPACPQGQFITDSTSVRHFSGNPSTSTSRQFTRYMKLKSEPYVSDLDWVVNLIAALDRPGRGGDHKPFFEQGYPAGRFTEPHENGDGSGNNGHQHNGTDFIDFVNIPYLARVVKTNLAGFATLAMAPDRPEGLEITDVGDGTAVFLAWPTTNTEPDFAFYRVAYRNIDSLFYENVVMAGNVNEFFLAGLQPDVSYYVSFSAADTDSNESIFSDEVMITPQVMPRVPSDFQTSSLPTKIILEWEAGEVDLVMHNIYRSMQAGAGFSLITDVPAGIEFYEDSNVSPGVMYYYKISAEDGDGNEGPLTNASRGRLVLRDTNIILLDGTKNGSGTNVFNPTDEAVDQFYDGILSGFNVNARYDLIDSISSGNVLSDADLSIYSVAVLHADVPATASADKIHADTTALRKFLQTGGKLWVTGWQLAESFTDQKNGIKVFPSGTFIHDLLQLDSIRESTTQENDFAGAMSLVGGYPTIMMDSVKMPLNNGNMKTMEAFLEPLVNEPVTEPIYSYISSNSGPNDGKPLGLRHLSAELEVIVTDFPLYYMDSTTAVEVVETVMSDLNEPPTGIDNGNGISVPKTYRLYPNYPNPFNPVTQIEFDLPVNARMELTIYNALGQKVKSLVHGDWSAGHHAVKWNGKNDAGQTVASGVYVYRLRAGDFVKSRKMILLR